MTKRLPPEPTDVIREALALLRKHQWALDGECPECGGEELSQQGHYMGCAWAAAQAG